MTPQEEYQEHFKTYIEGNKDADGEVGAFCRLILLFNPTKLNEWFKAESERNAKLPDGHKDLISVGDFYDIIGQHLSFILLQSAVVLGQQPGLVGASICDTAMSNLMNMLHGRNKVMAAVVEERTGKQSLGTVEGLAREHRQ